MNYVIKTILVPVDFSASANNALHLAVAMAERHNAVIHLLNVVPTFMRPPSMEMISGSGDELASLISQSKNRVQSCKDDILNGHQIDVLGQSEFGIPAEMISAYVVKNNIDLVLMGTHGMSGCKEFLIGSTAMKTIKECPCPVLTVPLNYSKTVFDSILYPVRTVAGMSEKYDYIRSIISRNNSSIHLLGLIQTNDGNNSELLSYMEKVIKVILEDEDLVTYQIYFCKNLADQILALAHERKDDLVVINATLDTDWKDFFSGSYTQQIINHANVPVLALKF